MTGAEWDATRCGASIAYPRESTGVCTRVKGHGGACCNGIAAIERDERDAARDDHGNHHLSAERYPWCADCRESVRAAGMQP